MKTSKKRAKTLLRQMFYKDDKIQICDAGWITNGHASIHRSLLLKYQGFESNSATSDRDWLIDNGWTEVRCDSPPYRPRMSFVVDSYNKRKRKLAASITNLIYRRETRSNRFEGNDRDLRIIKYGRGNFMTVQERYLAFVHDVDRVDRKLRVTKEDQPLFAVNDTICIMPVKTPTEVHEAPLIKVDGVQLVDVEPVEE